MIPDATNTMVAMSDPTVANAADALVQLSGDGYSNDEMEAASAMLELARSSAPPTVPSGPSDASGYDSDASTIGFPTPPAGATTSMSSPLYDDDDRTPAEMGLIPFSPRFYETPERRLNGTGRSIPSGYHAMPDGTIMSDDAHISGDGYYVV